MKRLILSFLGATLVGCAARVPVRVPAAPSVQMSGHTIAVIAADRSCRGVADQLAVRLTTLDGFTVHPDATSRLNLYACNHGTWMQGDVRETRAVAIAALSDEHGVVAHILGSASDIGDDNGAADDTVRLRRRDIDNLHRDVARDLAEQVAPVPTLVRRRVYANTSNDSARHYHNLAVAAERDGRIDDALWWAKLAWERRPTPRRARYVNELSRRLSRTAPGPSQVLSDLRQP